MNNRIAKTFFLGGMGWYLLLVTIHYFNQRPLWNDEACVFASIRDYTPAQMFSIPLSHVQQFPRFYIFCIQQLSKHFDFSLLALRFLPFLCMVAGFLVWMRLALKELGSDAAKLMYVLAWGASIPLIYYAAELKQYSMDVFSAALCLLFLTRQERLEKSAPSYYPWLLAALPCLGMFSYVAFLFFVFPLYNMIRLQSRRMYILLYVLMVLGVAAFIYVVDVRISNAAALREYWGEYFISFKSFPAFLSTTFEGVNNLISRWFAETPKWIRMAARFFVAFGLIEMVLGFKQQLKQDAYLFKAVRSVALIVFIELYVLGALRLYVFTVPRTSLFFAPIILLLTVAGFKRLLSWHRHLYRGLCGIFAVYLVVVSCGIAHEIFKGDLGAQSKILNAR